MYMENKIIIKIKKKIFQVWKDGQDPNSHIPYGTLTAKVEGGAAKAEWSPPLGSGNEMPPAEDPVFFFSVHSAWCPYKKSGNLTVELKRPELSEPEWQDKDGNSTDKGLAGETVKLSVSCNDDMEEGAGVIFTIFDKDGNEIIELGGENQDGKAEVQWQTKDIRKVDDRSELTYTFTAIAQRIKEVKSSSITLKNPQIIEMKWEPEVLYHSNKVKLFITSFEASDFSPVVKVQIWEDDEIKPQSYLYEQELNIDKDDIEIDIETNFMIEALERYNDEREYKLHAKIVCEDLPLKQSKGSNLIVATGAVYD